MDSRRITAVLAGLIGVCIVAIGTQSFLVDPAASTDGFVIRNVEAYLAVKGCGTSVRGSSC